MRLGFAKELGSQNDQRRLGLGGRAPGPTFWNEVFLYMSGDALFLEASLGFSDRIVLHSQS